jgi:membrane protease YdiL (CAAX protease family)
MVSGFFAPWKDEKEMIKFSSILAFFMVVGLLAIYVNFQDNPVEQTRVMVFMIMLVWAIMFGIIDWSSKKQTLMGGIGEYVQFGSRHKLIISAVVGIAFTLFVTGSLFTATPNKDVLSTIPFLSSSMLAFLYVVIIAPYAEEKFFASCVGPTSYKIFGGVLGLIITSAFFGFFHGFAYGWDYNLMLTAGIWRAMVLIGNQIFKSTGFSFAAHVANNYIAYTMIA